MEDAKRREIIMYSRSKCILYNICTMKTVLTSCGCAGSDGQGTRVMEDVKRRDIIHMYVQ